MCRTGWHETLCRVPVLLIKPGLSAARMFFGRTSPKHAAELGRRARLNLTTHALHNVLCRPVLHIAEAGKDEKKLPGRAVVRTNIGNMLKERRSHFVGYGKETILEPPSRFGDRPFKFQVVCPQNGTAVLKSCSAATATLTRTRYVIAYA